MDKEELKYKYLQDQLDQEESLAFKNLMQTDDEFREEVEFEETLKSTLIKDERQRLKQMLVEEERAKPNLAKPKLNVSWLKIAASIILFIAAGWLAIDQFSSPNYDDLYAENFESYPNVIHSFTRGDATEVTLEIKAFKAYENNDFEKSVKLFEQLKSSHSEPYISFYLAQSYLGKGELAKAERLFELSLKNDDDYKDESLWYLALVKLKKREEKEAKDFLKQLVTLGTYKKDEAKKLIEALD